MKSSTCPKCRRIQYFVCSDKNCVCWQRIPTGKKPQVSGKHDTLKCPYCGYTNNIDFWFERNAKLSQKAGALA
jgi:hypothetical protein